MKSTALVCRSAVVRGRWRVGHFCEVVGSVEEGKRGGLGAYKLSLIGSCGKKHAITWSSLRCSSGTRLS